MAALTITFREFAVSGTDPSGHRADDSHASFTKVLGVGANEQLDFGKNNISNSGINSSTKAVVGCLATSGDLTLELFNMKFWLPSVTTFATGTMRYNQDNSSGWIQNVVINNSSGTTPTALPSSGNLLRQDGSGVIQASGDGECTEWIYLSIFADTNVPVGVYGGAGLNTFRYRLTADYI